MTRLDQAARVVTAVAAVVAALCLVLVAWSFTTRTTPLVGQGVYRENLLTGEDQFCGVSAQGAGCVLVWDASRPNPPA